MDKNASNSEAQKQLFEILLTETNNKNYCEFNKQLLTKIVISFELIVLSKILLV